MRRFLAITAALAAFVSPASAVTPFFDDAAVRSVQFVDRNEGWAVGDDGAIWHTIDGGGNWERQPSGVRCSLRGVHFMTPYTGWAVGRQETPSGSVGVVLFTTDGGLKWTQVGLNAMPGLNCVRFFDGHTGVVAGDGSDAFPTGVFTTSDGGQTWRPVPGPRCPSWLAADFADSENGVLAGAWGRLAPVRSGLFGVAEVDSLGGRGVTAIKVSGPRAVAVGQGGLILVSQTSAGVRWGFATPRLPREVLSACDFAAVSVVGDHLWVVGRPGSVVFHSADFGKSWETLPTNQTLPLHAVHFLNENEGWAAGELGVILTTRDGGKSWKVQREGGQRSAALFVHGHGKSTPVDAFAALGVEGGYLTAALQVASPDPASSPKNAASADRLRFATRAAGGASAESLWQFPLAKHLDGQGKASILEGWNAIHDGRAPEDLLRQLVLAIRVWRPEVVVCDAMPSAFDTDPVAGMTYEAMKEAFKQAGDPAAFPEQIDKLGLKAWGAKKLYCVQPNEFQTQVHLDLGEVQPRCADTLRNFATPAAALLADRPEVPRQRHFRLVASRLQGAMNHESLMEGIDLAHGGTARRTQENLPPVEVAKAEIVAAAVKRWSHLEALAKGVGQGDNPLATPDQVLAHLAPVLKDMPTEQGARAAFALAGDFAASGHWHLARECYLLCAERYPSHPQAAEAYRWLVRYQASSEARRRQELGHFMLTTETKSRPLQMTANGAEVRGGSELVQASHLSLLTNADEARRWYKGSTEIEPKLAAFGPLFARDPGVNLCLIAARRQLGEVDVAAKWCADYLKATAPAPNAPTVAKGDDPFRDCVMAEVWLRDRTSPNNPKPLGHCRRADARPHLDGKLDDACWDGVKALSLRDASGDSKKDHATVAKLAYDRDFLYVGVVCHHPAATPVKKAERRGHDADLRGSDRVSLTIDLDRDYQTYYQLQFDAAGRVADDCWGDRTWNPKWFAAVEDTEEGWTAEVAIPMRELTAEVVPLNRVWAFNVARTLPGKGVQAWSVPADAEPRPEGMGLLQFVEDPKAKR